MKPQNHDALAPATRYRVALVLGLGRSGLAAARLLRREGAQVVVAERQRTPALEAQADALRAEGVTVSLGVETPMEGSFDVAVISPGISTTSPWARAVLPRDVPVIGELELAAARCPCPLLAITGTNGKSTLTKLCSDLLVRAGKRAAPCGNYGVPLAELVLQDGGYDWLVVEVSSFQLETVRRFHPRVAVLLNLQPNHLDRHSDLETYLALKLRLFANQDKMDTAIVLDSLAEDVRTRVRTDAAWVSFGTQAGTPFRYRPGIVELPRGQSVTIAGTYFDNLILGPAAAAAVAALTACGLDPDGLGEGFRAFEPLPHRMQPVGEAGGVRFVNDSKATTLAAMCAGLAMTPGPVRLIAGGLLKEHDLARAQEMLAKRASAIYLIGNAAHLMQAAWGETVPCRISGKLESAVREAWREAAEGDTILLSPGCASFDQFRSFEARGEQFVRIVRQIREETGR